MTDQAMATLPFINTVEISQISGVPGLGDFTNLFLFLVE